MLFDSELPTSRRAPGSPEMFDSQDLGEIEDYVSKIYSKMRIGAVGEHTRARIARQSLAAGIGFDLADYTFDIGYSAEPPERLIICDVISNTIESANAETGDTDTFGPGDQFLIARPGFRYGGVGHSSTLRLTLVDPVILDRVAAGVSDGEERQVRLLDHRPVSRAAHLHLQRVIAYLRDQVMAAPDVPAAPLIVSTASQYLAASVLSTYPNTAVIQPTATDRRDATPTTLRRAIAFIESNADLDLTVSDIAQTAYVTPRALQLAFRRHLDTTPMAYLRHVRLEHAREELRSETPDSGVTVTKIALRWGFTSSRFSQQYLSAYGESPSQTLRN